MRISKTLLCDSVARGHLSYKIVGWQLQPVLGSNQKRQKNKKNKKPTRKGCFTLIPMIGWFSMDKQ